VRRSFGRATVSLAALLWVGDASAHHSAAVFDNTKKVELRGTIVDFKLRNPHSSFVLDARTFVDGKPSGRVERWEIESEASSMLRSLGIDAQTFEVGDPITIRAWPNRDSGFRFAHAFEILDAFGAEYALTNSTRLFSPSLRAAADKPAIDKPAAASGNGIARLVGRWQQPLLRFATNGASLPLNEAGLAAWRSYDRKRSPANSCEPINVPDIFFQPFFLLDLRIDEHTAVLHNEIYDIVRTVPLTGVPAPADKDGWYGMTSGHVEGEALVVESHGFRASRWGLGGEEAHGGADVPSSEQKKLTERFSVTPDGRTLIYDYTLEDAAYLTEAKQGRVELTRVPDGTEMYPYLCDLESAGMWSRRRGDAPLRVGQPR